MDVYEKEVAGQIGCLNFYKFGYASIPQDYVNYENVSKTPSIKGFAVNIQINLANFSIFLYYVIILCEMLMSSYPKRRVY